MVETEEAVRSWANFLIEAAGIFSVGETCAIAVSSVKGSEGNAASRSLPSTSLALLTDSCLASLRAEVTNRPREGALLEACLDVHRRLEGALVELALITH